MYIPDGPLEGEEIAVAVRVLSTVWTVVPSDMRSEHLKGWLREDTWTTMVITPKGVGDYRMIGLVEVIWKVCVSIMNNRLRVAIALHKSLHVFVQGVGGGNHGGESVSEACRVV